MGTETREWGGGAKPTTLRLPRLFILINALQINMLALSQIVYNAIDGACLSVFYINYPDNLA